MIARGTVPVATPDFPKATGTVFCIPIFVPLFPDPAMLKRTRGYFWSELCLASKSGCVLQSGHINTNAKRRSSRILAGRNRANWAVEVVLVAAVRRRRVGRLHLEASMRKSIGEKKKPCKNCEGKGTLKKGDKIVRCQRCGGTGIKPS